MYVLTQLDFTNMHQGSLKNFHWAGRKQGSMTSFGCASFETTVMGLEIRQHCKHGCGQQCGQLDVKFLEQFAMQS